MNRELAQRRSDLLLGAMALFGAVLHLLFLRSYGWFRRGLKLPLRELWPRVKHFD